MRLIATQFRIGESTLGKLITKVCEALWERLSPTYLPKPTEAIWRVAEAGWRETWNFPNCLGAIDGKHVNIQAPPNSGTSFHNYKKGFSVVLLAVANFNYKFTYIDVGSHGSSSDSHIWRNSAFCGRMDAENLYMPPDACLPGDEGGRDMPLVFVADEAFAASTRVLRPFPRGRGSVALSHRKKVFNYRLSRARRVVENAFGILAGRFRFLSRPVHMLPEKVDILVKAAVALHNLLTKPSDEIVRRVLNQDITLDHDSGIESWRATASRNASVAAKQVRDYFADYFMNQGSVHWQNEYAHVNTVN
jgi:hypothetical protein